jgi:hypothetical protein
MIEMLRIYSKGFLENVTIEELTPLAFHEIFTSLKSKSDVYYYRKLVMQDMCKPNKDLFQ